MSGRAPAPDASWRAVVRAMTPAQWVETAAIGCLVAALVVFVAGVVAPWAGVGQYGFVVAAAVLLGAGGLLLVLFGPSWVVVTLFLAKMITGHQFRSMYILPLMGIEWHPREFWLLLLLAHFAVKLIMGRIQLRLDLYHYFFYLYCFYFVFVAGVGVWHQWSRTEILEECRYPLFLGAYFVFAACVDSRRDVWFHGKVILALTALIAAGACLFFLYTVVSGQVINVQNVYGEYVRRQIGPRLLQSVRPNGHMFYEVCFIVLVALLFSRELTARTRALFVGLLGLFSFAILITMMRTAYVTLACSLAILVLLSLPKSLRWVTLFGGGAAAAIVLAVFGTAFYEHVSGQLPDLEASLRGRVAEMQGAWDLFARDPLIGAGMGSSFEALNWGMKSSGLVTSQSEFQTVHNAWMYFLLKGGLVGLFLVLAALGGILARAYGAMERMCDAQDRLLMKGLLAATAGQLVASLAMPRLTYPIGHVFLAMMTCAFFLMGREDESGPGRRTRAVAETRSSE